MTKNGLKYNPMSDGKYCLAEPNLEVLPLRYFSKGLVCFFFKLMYYKITKNSAASRNLPHVINN